MLIATHCVNCRKQLKQISQYSMDRCRECWRKFWAEKEAQRGKCEVIPCNRTDIVRKTVFGRNAFVCPEHSHLGHDAQEA